MTLTDDSRAITAEIERDEIGYDPDHAADEQNGNWQRWRQRWTP